MATEVKTCTIERAQIVFRNFEGKEGQFNRKGDRNFSVILTPEAAEDLLRDGWNVKYLKPTEEGDEPRPYITVAVNFQNRPPRVVMITSNARTNLNEDTIEVLDYANIGNADLIFRSYEWTVNGKTGIKAYLQTLFVTIEEDELERKYAANEV